MSGTPAPVFIPEAFAVGASGSFKNTIPDTTGITGLASWNVGFPPITMTPETSSGIPPKGQDFNGVLYAMCTHTVALQAGQQYAYASAVSSQNTGYALGAFLQSADGTGFWLNNSAGNTTDPDGGSSANWIPAWNYGYTTVAGLAASNVTLTPAQYRKGVIILTGTLTANINIIFPGLNLSWLIVNACTGAFTVTAKTATGSGQVVPAGGYAAPYGVYQAANAIYPTVSPLSYPIDAAATASTLALRTNTGGLAATSYNDSSSLSNPTVGAVLVQNAAADGTYRKISLTNLEAQMLLQNIGGALTTGQISQAAVGQYFTQSLTTNPGQVVFPIGSDTHALKIQMGSSLVHTNVADGSVYTAAIAFGTSFTNLIAVVAQVNNSAFAVPATMSTIAQVTAKNNAGFSFQTNNQTGGSTRAGNQMCDWIAIGY